MSYIVGQFHHIFDTPKPLGYSRCHRRDYLRIPVDMAKIIANKMQGRRTFRVLNLFFERSWSLNLHKKSFDQGPDSAYFDALFFIGPNVY